MLSFIIMESSVKSVGLSIPRWSEFIAKCSERFRNLLIVWILDPEQSCYVMFYLFWNSLFKIVYFLSSSLNSTYILFPSFLEEQQLCTMISEIKRSIFQNIQVSTFPSNSHKQSIITTDYTCQSFLIWQFIFLRVSKVIKVPTDTFLLQYIEQYQVLVCSDNKHMLPFHMHVINCTIHLVDKQWWE